jgi:hypothetical protein
MKLLSCLLLILTFVFLVYIKAENPPELVLRPDKPMVTFAPGESIMKDILILNKGGKNLKITEVKPSCFCASVIVHNADIRPMGKGMITLSVNTDRMEEDSLLTIDFVLKSNAKEPEHTFTLSLHNKKFIKDTLSNPH